MILIRRVRDQERLLESYLLLLAAGKSGRAVEGGNLRDLEELVEGDCGGGSGRDSPAGSPCLS